MSKALRSRFLLIAVIVVLAVLKLTPIKKAINLGLDLQGGSYLTLEVDDSAVAPEQKAEVVDVALEIIRNRVDEFGVAEPIVQKSGRNRIIIQVPGIGTEGAKRIKDIVMRQAHLEFRLVEDDADKLAQVKDGALSGVMARNYDLLPWVEEDGKDNKKPLLVEKESRITGDMLEDARVSFDHGGFGGVGVSLSFNKKGARRFDQLTGANVQKRLAIVLDGKVQSAPVIQQRISGGQASITGSFNTDQAKDLAIALRAGALPAPVHVIQESTVGPSLGADSINKGIKSAVWGLMAVIAFMALYYGLSGVLADFVLCLNLLFVMAMLSFFNATLTLPGIAGIILTIGMAVDANVLIFERIREELDTDKGPKAAVHAGFKKAFSTILDSNITTLITALVLYKFGTGPVRGFAVTLSVGILASMFAALYVSRAIFEWILETFKIRRLSI